MLSGCNSVQFTTQEILLTKRFNCRLPSSSVVGNTVCGCRGYKVNGVTGDDVW